jgi:AcrR family transcriptional regulator
MKPPSPKLRRSDATRLAILEAARERFAADGYERATIRAIASQAEIDPALVMRYYGSKEGLFAAAAQFDLRLPDLRSTRRTDLGATLIAHFLEVWEKDEIFFALLRSAVTNKAAADRMKAIFQAQVVPAIAAVVEDRESIPIRAGLVSSQLLGLALCRYVLRLPPVRALERSQIIGNVAPVLQNYLCGPLIQPSP